ncbi:hypothetical protein EK21DRAFT_80096 [Setomelanomma holmii]|uniref:Structure-specific endonuclease subunit SLX4 n=1 Tax=Setomelanomma holmii TaxID=210430 RepID=A0A9P4GYE9_9PLEO|nr:hypothetical protein EK21DRAFT_80096 [Setomelanomma holmii]
MAGTSFDIVVLSSSPPAAEIYAPSSPLNAPRRSSPRRVAMPALPLLSLSPPISPQKKTSGASLTGSRKTSIPPDAITGFATVGSLVRSERFAQQPDDEFAEIPKAQSPRGSIESANFTTTKKKTRKRPTVTSATDDDSKPKPKPRVRKPKVDTGSASTRDPELRLPPPKTSSYFEAEVAEPRIEPQEEPTIDPTTKLTKAGKSRKPRAKKEKIEGAEAEPKVRKPRVARAKMDKVVGKKQQDDACMESAHFRKATGGDDQGTTRASPTRDTLGKTSEDVQDASIWDVPPSPRQKKKQPPKQRPPDPGPQSLDLEEAVSRRREWTPPQDTVTACPFADSIGKENREVEETTGGGGFTAMISNFAFAQPSTSKVSATTTQTEVMAAKKRRRIELVDVPNNHNQPNSRNSSPEKGKAPKKKARTITDIATEQYQPKPLDSGHVDVTSDFFQLRTTVTKVPLDDVATAGDNAIARKPPRKRSTSKPDSEKASTKTRTKKTSAKATVKSKSKPVAEKLLSPNSALLRLGKQDILFGTSSQLALEESPTLVRQLQQAMKESEGDAYSPRQLMAPPRWPKLEKVVGKRGLWDASSRDVEGGLLEQMDDVYIHDFDQTQDFPLLMDGTVDGLEADPPSFVEIGHVESAPAAAVVISSDPLTPPRTTSWGSQTRPYVDVSDYAMAETVFEDIDGLGSQPPPSNQNAELQDSFADIDDMLPVATKSSTMRPPKPRPPAPNFVVDSPNKRRGRPPKPHLSAPPATPARSSGRFIDIDEILDSEDEARQAFSPTPPRIRKLQASEPLPLFSTSPTRTLKKSKTTPDPSVVPIACVRIAQLDWTTFKSIVFSAITAHTRSLPPTTNPKRPSWHEKILMYDPIVLEDFTAYLNVSTSIRTWKRATKLQVKAWNKELISLGEPAIDTTSPAEILAVAKVLEAWQVQAWCESMSICCIWGEGRGKGGVRKGLY